MTGIKKPRINRASLNTSLQTVATASMVVLPQTNRVYHSHSPICQTVSPKHCEFSPNWLADLQKRPNLVLRLALLIFKSGLNRILLTVVRSGAATPNKMFLMLARLTEITNQLTGLGQQQLLIDDCTLNNGEG
jgi:hypothetical protein